MEANLALNDNDVRIPDVFPTKTRRDNQNASQDPSVVGFDTRLTNALDARQAQLGGDVVGKLVVIGFEVLQLGHPAD